MMKKKHIVIISQETNYKTNWGGISTYFQNLVENISNNNVLLSILSFDGSGTEYYKIDSSKIQVTFLKIYPNKYVKGVIHTLPSGLKKIVSWLLWNIAVVREVSSITKNNDIFHITFPLYKSPFFFFFLFPKISISSSLHGEYSMLRQYLPKSIESNFFSVIEKVTLRLLKNVSACSESVKEIEAPEKAVIVPNPLQARYQTSSVSSYSNNRLVYFGRLESRKGVDVLINAFFILKRTQPSLELHLIGNEGGGFFFKNKWHTFDQLLNQKPFSNQLFVHQHTNDKMALFEKLSILNGITICPSKIEPFGYTLLESMMLGLVTVGSKVTNHKQFIQDEYNGFLLHPNTKSIISKIEYIQRLDSKSIKKIQENAVNSYDKLHQHFKRENISWYVNKNFRTG